MNERAHVWEWMNGGDIGPGPKIINGIKRWPTIAAIYGSELILVGNDDNLIEDNTHNLINHNLDDELKMTNTTSSGKIKQND